MNIRITIPEEWEGPIIIQDGDLRRMVDSTSIPNDRLMVFDLPEGLYLIINNLSFYECALFQVEPTVFDVTLHENNYRRKKK